MLILEAKANCFTLIKQPHSVCPNNHRCQNVFFLSQMFFLGTKQLRHTSLAAILWKHTDTDGAWDPLLIVKSTLVPQVVGDELRVYNITVALCNNIKRTHIHNAIWMCLISSCETPFSVHTSSLSDLVFAGAAAEASSSWGQSCDWMLICSMFDTQAGPEGRDLLYTVEIQDSTTWGFSAMAAQMSSQNSWKKKPCLC